MSSSNQQVIYSRTGIINPRSGIGTSIGGSAATDNRSQADDRGHQDRYTGKRRTRDENMLMGHGENIDAEDEIFEGRQLHINCKPKNLLTRLSPPPEHHEPFERDAWRYQNDSFFEGRSRFEKWRGGRVHRGGRPWNRRGFRSRSPLSRNRATDRLPENVNTMKEILIGLKMKDSPDIIIALRNSDIIRKYMEFARISSDIAKDLLYIVAKGLMSTTIPALAKKLVKIVEEEDLIRTLIQTEPCTLPNKAKMIYYVHVLLRRISKITPSNKQYIDRQMQQTNTFIAELKQNEQEIAVFELLNKVDEIKLYLSKFIAGEITDDFSQMKIFPTTCDIENDPFEGLCKNKITSSYTNEFEYLETHFKLMRADCFIPLRNGILEMRKLGGNTRPQRLNDAFVYYRVKIVAPCLANGIGYELVFDTSRSRAKRDRLKYGSLVALSADNFQTYHFATVFDSENKGKGEIQVKFEFTQSADIYALSKNPLTMIEPASGYFESYRHVLSVLQDYAKENITIPLRDYIVYNAPEISPPKYIPSNAKNKLRLARAHEEHSFEEKSVQFRNETNRESPTSSADSESCKKLTNVKDADIKYVSSNKSGIEDKRHSKQAIWFKDSSLSDSLTERKAMFCGNASTLTPFNVDVDVFSDTFPSASDLDMDVDQKRAFTNAITKELSIIQGPPGCGKTYVGLKIAEVLLDNNNDKTIMVVCYTNHALDQFMREIIAHNPTSNVVRIGGRSKDEQIQNITLAKKRKMRPNLPDDLFQSKKEALNDKNNISMNLCENMLKSKLIKESIVYHNVLKKQISSTYYTCFEQISYHYGCPALLWWLADGSSDLSRVFLSSVRKDVSKRVLPECVRNIIRDTIKTNVFNQRGLVEYALTDKIALHISELDTHPELRLKYCRHLRGGNADSESGYPDIFDPSFPLAERWKLYRGWVNDYCKQFENEIFNIAEEYEDHVKRVSEICMLVDKHILESADVIGVTTTGAAKNWNLIKEIGPKIVIAEEAAEVFESHLFSSLTPSCQHLILIGDHKQLRPNPAVFRLAREYKLDISLFEKMVKNNFPYDKLRSQHRMRPEIADNMRIKDLYPGLIDDPCVLCYDPIKGVEGNMFFLDHRNYEEQDTQTRSHINMFEAMFLVELCHYLLLQGYEDSQITILSMYNGQMFKIKDVLQKKLNRRSLIRVDNVDNYQGEENDIILLSLVRSNDIGKKGFVGHLNRICVSMSRAKKGLFIIGNKRTLCSGQSKWQSILLKMCKMNAVNTKMTLVCQNHPERKVYVESSEDFMQCPDGGCDKKCTFEMICGHVCLKHCHSYDREHNGIVCRQRCQRQCINGHSCRLECNVRCPPCMETVVKTLECGHKLSLSCYEDNGKFVCNAICSKQLQPCGHTCAKKCHESCVPCVERIQVLNEKCGHVNEVQCFLSHKSGTCKYPCKKKLNCDHICLKICSDPCEPCTSKVTYKRDSCSHLAERQCHQLESTDSCQKTCDLILDCGHLCQNICGATYKPLSITTDGSVSTCPKGHTSFCKERCSYKLACGHQCQGDCKRCDKGRRHMMCDQECNVELLCCHTKRATCNSFSSLMLCPIDCAKKCRHTDCKLQCCESCKVCEHDCDWGCKHLKCTKRCGEICDRERCNDNCDKTLAKCGHDCTGLCGDPCPDICFLCDKDVFQEEDLAHRFVQLHDCGDIVRSTEMDKYMDTTDDSCFKACPVCSKPVQTTNANRYEKVVNAQWKAFDKTKTNQTSRTSCDEILFEHIGDTKSSLPLNMQRIKDITNINKNRLKECLKTHFNVDSLPLLQKHIEVLPFIQDLYHELERETQRFLHADVLVTIVNKVDKSNLPDLQDKLTVATDILDVTGPYTDELQDAFHTYIGAEFPQNVDKAKLMRLRFEWKPIEFNNTDEAVQTLKDVLINECTRVDNDVLLLTLLKWDGRNYLKTTESRERAVEVKGISLKTVLENRQKRPPERRESTQKQISGSKLVLPSTSRQPEVASREKRSTRDSKGTAATNKKGNSQMPKHPSTHNDRTSHGAAGYNDNRHSIGGKRARENDDSYHNQDSNSKRAKTENRNSLHQSARQGSRFFESTHAEITASGSGSSHSGQHSSHSSRRKEGDRKRKAGSSHSHDNKELEDRRHVRRRNSFVSPTTVITDTTRPLTDYSDLF